MTTAQQAPGPLAATPSSLPGWPQAGRATTLPARKGLAYCRIDGLAGALPAPETPLFSGLLAGVADVTRFPDKAHFASWNGTAPIDASSGDQVRHRLSRAGNRQINRALHIMAVVQLRHRASEGRACYDRKVAAGKTPMEAMRCPKRRLSDIACHQMVPGARAKTAGPGGHLGAATGSSAAGSHPAAGTSEKSLPGPATSDPTPPRPARFSGRSARLAPPPDRSRCQAPVCLIAARTGAHSQGRKRPS